MKKFILLLCFLILILCTYSFKPNFIKTFKENDLIFGDIQYSIYCLSVDDYIPHSEVLNIGNGFIVRTKPENASYVKSKVSNILGESIKFSTTFAKIENIIKLYDVEILKEEKIGDIYTLYGYSKSQDFNKSIKIDEENVNIQIAFNQGVLVMGTPIILGDY